MEEATGEDIVITQPEAHELQKAKATMYTGVSILMRSLRIIKDEISKVFVAGGFDTYIDIASLRSMGVLLDFPLVDIKQVGNAAGTGAS